MVHPPVMSYNLEIIFRGYEDAMALVNTEFGIDDCIAFVSLDIPCSFLDAMYQNLSSNKHNVSEFISLKKLLYR